jgi:hypothetical protein
MSAARREPISGDFSVIKTPLTRVSFDGTRNIERLILLT